MYKRGGFAGIINGNRVKKIISVLFIVMLFISGTHEGSGKLKSCLIKIYGNKGQVVKLRVEVAASERDRQNGLMYRMSLDENSGMLFVFERAKRLSFWMKNTYIPLDIAFIDSDGVIQNIYQMKPLDTSILYSSTSEVRYALEVNQWWFARNGVTVGSRIGINGCISK